MDSRQYLKIHDDHSYIKPTWGVYCDDNIRRGNGQDRVLSHWPNSTENLPSEMQFHNNLGLFMFLSFDSASVLLDTEGNTIPSKVPMYVMFIVAAETPGTNCIVLNITTIWNTG